MFKDCKTGGYNLEGSLASGARLISLILLIALAMSSAWLQGEKIKLQKQSTYVCRSIEPGRTRKRHSNFWIGLYGMNWIAVFDECQIWVREMMATVRNKLPFYQRGLNAMKLIHQAL